jgi:hypothetical protein
MSGRGCARSAVGGREDRRGGGPADAYVVDTLLGAPSHPDEVALRAATLRTMVEIQKAKEPG